MVVRAGWLSILLVAAAGCRTSHPASERAQEHIAACARGDDGVWCSRFAGAAFAAPARWTSDFGYAAVGAGGDDVLLTPDLDGDGQSDLCVREAAGLACALRAGADAFGPTLRSGAFADDDGFAQWPVASTLAFADVDGDGLADACARQPAALLCAHGRGDGEFDAPVSWLDGALVSDSGAVCDATIRLGDLDGDGAADVCVGCSDGVRCALSRGDHFAAPTVWTRAFASDDSRAEHHGRFELVTLDGDARRDICGRHGSEVRCERSDGTRFGGGAVIGDVPEHDAVRYADVDGDRLADLCLFDAAGSRCATSRSGFALQAWDGDAADGALQRAWALELVDVDGDGRADRCQLGNAGLSCARSDGARFVARAMPAPFSAAAPASANLDLTTAVIGARARSSPTRTNRVAVENQRPGADDWWIPYPQWSMGGEVEAYVDRLSYRAGDSVRVMLSTAQSGDAVDWRLLRTGWYGGRGARQLLDGRVYGHAQPPSRAAGRESVRAGWTPTFSFRIPDDAISGVYVLRLDSQGSGKSFFVTFVVRDDGSAELLFDRADLTDEAYNDWDGHANQSSAYLGSPWVSFDRPLRSVAALGKYSYSSGYFLYEYPLVRWLESQGYDVGYVSDLDVHDGIDLGRARAFLSVGHAEYWSAAMRDHVEAARDRGLSLAFFGSDADDGIVRFLRGDPRSFSRTLSDSDDRKNESADKPIAPKRPPHDNPSDTLTGTHYVSWCAAPHPECQQDPVAKLRIADDFHIVATTHPIFRGVDVTQPLRQVVGYEYEMALDDTSALPFTLDRLAKTGLRNGLEPAMVAYRAASGARVVNIGSMLWAHALDPWAGRAALRLTGGERACEAGESDCFERHERAAAQITANILSDFGVVAATPSATMIPSAPQRWP